MKEILNVLIKESVELGTDSEFFTSASSLSHDVIVTDEDIASTGLQHTSYDTPV